MLIITNNLIIKKQEEINETSFKEKIILVLFK